MDQGKVCCFTGHRTIAASHAELLPSLLDETLERLHQSGTTEFRAGGALGFDTMAAHAVIRLKKRYSDVRLVLYLPCREQCNKWRPADIKVYKEILAEADSVSYVTTFYHPLCMQTRNMRMVDDADFCVCYKHAGVGGGASYTVKYAKESEVEIINLADILDA